MSLMAQSSKGFSFQGYARGGDGSALQNKTNLEVKFTIFSTDENNAEFVEAQTLSTDEFGVFQAVIGTTNSSMFNALNFSQKDYSLKVEVKDGGSYQQVAHQSLLAVPYAKASEKAVEATLAANGCPPGSIMPFAGNSVPEGWLLCNGSTVDRIGKYSKLFSAIGEAWGQGDNNSTFNLPDLRGQFLRGVSGGTNDDPERGDRTAKNTGGNTGDNVGSYQNDNIKSHNHSANTSSAGNHKHPLNGNAVRNGGSWDDGDDKDNIFDIDNPIKETKYAGTHTHSVTVYSTGGPETRPKNAYVNYIIKY